MRRYQELSDQQRGLVVMALLANAVVTVILEAALALAGFLAGFASLAAQARDFEGTGR